jgi:hypothetical protein
MMVVGVVRGSKEVRKEVGNVKNVDQDDTQERSEKEKGNKLKV